MAVGGIGLTRVHGRPRGWGDCWMRLGGLLDGVGGIAGPGDLDPVWTTLFFIWDMTNVGDLFGPNL